MSHPLAHLSNVLIQFASSAKVCPRLLRLPQRNLYLLFYRTRARSAIIIGRLQKPFVGTRMDVY